jgi:hypothetical protein
VTQSTRKVILEQCIQAMTRGWIEMREEPSREQQNLCPNVSLSAVVADVVDGAEDWILSVCSCISV